MENLKICKILQWIDIFEINYELQETAFELS